LRVEADVPLAPRTTLGLGGVAKRLVRVERAADVPDALALAGGDPVLVLGGGSNLVVRDGGFDGLVLELAIPGVFAADDIVTAHAGVVWDDFVAMMIDDGRAGVECMSGIPGLVGATPMQNVGAYGQEVADTIAAVQVFDRHSGRFDTIAAASCRFGYRSSMFRGSDRWIVVEVAFRLPRSATSAPVRYAELAKALGVAEGASVPLREVRDTVLRLRRGKGMVVDPGDPDSRSAGSFFTNPLVDAAAFAALAARLPGVAIPHWAQPDGRIKLSAGWLIERAGFAKGYTAGRVRISTKHALALVNTGGATTRELLALAREIQDRVAARLGVELHAEPIIVGRD
jgi:UDP-N-acetylmuramate dehydrogenase